MNDMPHDHTHDARAEAKKNDARQRAMAQNAPAGNTGARWLAGAAAAAVLLGGGYYALKNMPASQPAAEVASVDPGYGATASTSPYVTTSTPGATIDTAGVAPADSTVTTETKSAATAPTRRRTTTTTTTTTAATTVPEEVIGVSPASLTTTADNSDEIVVTAGLRPVWVSRPSARRLSALYPERALERGREGEASVHCTVQDGGSLACVRASEYPTNAGFGNAALRVASRYKHAAQLADGSSATGTPVNLRVIFRIADNDRRRG